MLKTFKIILLLFWLGYIFYLSSIPSVIFNEPTPGWLSLATHIFLYAVLALLLSQALAAWQPRQSRSGNSRLLFWVVVICLLYGISDEYHQAFVPGRFVSFLDLAWDSLGAAIGALLYLLVTADRKAKLLLQICCAGCGVYISGLLKANFKVTLYFYNPNIHPQSEHQRRLQETEKIAKNFFLPLLVEPYDHDQWRGLTAGRENDPERGERCRLCYQDRLSRTAKLAADKKFAFFASTLSVSPHKDARLISRLGNQQAKQHGVVFYDQDFKKRDGYKKSTALAKKLKLYRQDYCGCEYSRRPKAAKQ